LDDACFVIAKRLLPVLLKDPLNALAESIDNQLIGVNEITTGKFSKATANRALACTHHSNQYPRLHLYN
jgi:hypothetical protein